MTFGEKIKQARKTLGLTQRQLADIIGAKHNSISDWENDKNKPDPDTIELLLGALKINANDLFESTSSAEYYGFEDYISSLGWNIRAFPKCEENASCQLSEDDFVQKNVNDKYFSECENCEFNGYRYFLSKNDNYYKISENELSELQNSIKSFITFQINNIIQQKKRLSAYQFRIQELGESNKTTLKAAHNDNETDQEEIDKMNQDLDDLND